MEDNSVLNFFYDVPSGAYYYEARQSGRRRTASTGGVGNDLLHRTRPARAQTVTFLWRAAGSPVV